MWKIAILIGEYFLMSQKKRLCKIQPFMNRNLKEVHYGGDVCSANEEEHVATQFLHHCNIVQQPEWEMTESYHNFKK